MTAPDPEAVAVLAAGRTAIDSLDQAIRSLSALKGALVLLLDRVEKDQP